MIPLNIQPGFLYMLFKPADHEQCCESVCVYVLFVYVCAVVLHVCIDRFFFTLPLKGMLTLSLNGSCPDEFALNYFLFQQFILCIREISLVASLMSCFQCNTTRKIFPSQRPVEPCFLTLCFTYSMYGQNESVIQIVIYLRCCLFACLSMNKLKNTQINK